MNKKVLVTGGSGFLGLQLIISLLEQGFEVRTTLRSLTKQQAVIADLAANGVTAIDRLSFVTADLAKDAHWEEAMEDCDYVLSVASPVFFTVPKNEEDAIRPAVEGITRILNAAQKAGVKRVVMTSNFGAVGFSKKKTAPLTTEKDWTDVAEKGLSLYEKSKLLAEKAAWDFVARPDCTLEFVTVNPVAIFGPTITNHISGSFHLLTNLLNGSMKRIPDLPLNVVDVRDVVALHLLALTVPEAAGQRFIASADGMITLPQIAELLRNKRPQLSSKISRKTLPTGLLRVAAPFSRQAREALLLIDMNRRVSTENAAKLLGFRPRSTNEQAVLSAVDSMAHFHLLDTDNKIK